MLAACLGEQGRLVEVGPHRDHQLDLLGDGRQRRRRRPGVERRLLDALDVVEVELGDQGQVLAGLLAPLRQALGHSPSSPPSPRRECCAASRRRPASSSRTSCSHSASAIAACEVVDEPLVRVPAEHVQRLRDEVGHGVDVVEAGRAVAVVDRSLRRRRHRGPPPGRSARPRATISGAGVTAVIRMAARPGWATQASAGQRSKLSPPVSTSIA